MLALLLAAGYTAAPEPVRPGCYPLPAAIVGRVPHGYVIYTASGAARMFFEQDIVLPSGDGQFWICRSRARNLPPELYAPPDPAESQPEHDE